MNYRHHYHAGNFADVMKHVLLLQLLRGMQRKDKGFLYLDTHAGRGGYQLSLAARGDSLERKPEWPDGIGRLLSSQGAYPPPVTEFLQLVRSCAKATGATETGFYPGSPLLAASVGREQDRLTLCEKHPEEVEHLRDAMSPFRRATVQSIDGYTGLRAALPCAEKRALVLIDPPFEEQNEFERIALALKEGLRRMPAATFAVWYPLTERARIEAFFEQLQHLALPPTWVAELWVGDDVSGIRMRGCGLLVVNPPWKLDETIAPVLPWLADTLAQAPGEGSSLQWLIHEA